MASLVTLSEFKSNLNVTWTDEDVILNLILDASESAVLEYIKRDYGWTSLTVPKHVKLAILILGATYYDPFRDGDNFDNEKIAFGYLPPAVTALLHRLRSPAYA